MCRFPVVYTAGAKKSCRLGIDHVGQEGLLELVPETPNSVPLTPPVLRERAGHLPRRTRTRGFGTEFGVSGRRNYHMVAAMMVRNRWQPDEMKRVSFLYAPLIAPHEHRLASP